MKNSLTKVKEIGLQYELKGLRYRAVVLLHNGLGAENKPHEALHLDRPTGSFQRLSDTRLVATLYDDKYYTMMSVWLFGQPGSRLPTLLICKVNAIRTPLCTGSAVLCTLFNINQLTLFIPWFKQSCFNAFGGGGYVFHQNKC